MIGLGLRLSLGGGREGWTRLGVIAAGVTVGVLLLLLAVSGLQLLKTSSSSTFWWCTVDTDSCASMQDHASKEAVPVPTNALLWREAMDVHNGKQITRFDVATTGPKAPIIPGLTRAVQPGECFVSPAMAGLLKKTPDNQLDNRFPSKLTGQIGRAGLRSPGELLVIVGHTPAEMKERFSYLGYLTKLQATPEVKDYGPVLIAAFFVIVGGLLFAIWSMVMTATRLGAARREEKFATLRLFGATPRQITVIAAVDAVLGAAIGLAAAIVLFYIFRPFFGQGLAGMIDVYPDEFTPGLIGITLIVVGVFAVSTAASLLSLRRVRLSPLGVSRKTTPKPPGAWRIVPLLLGVGIMIFVWLVNKDIADTLEKGKLTPHFIAGFGITLVGIVLAGPWLTQQITRLLAKLSVGAPSLLAARRLADNPKGAFRSVNVLVIATFLATFLATFTPLLASTEPTQNKQPTVQYTYFTSNYFVGRGGLQPAEAKEALQALRNIPGTTVVSWHAETITNNTIFNHDTFMRCHDLHGKQIAHHALCDKAGANTTILLPAGSRESAYTNQPAVASQAKLAQKDVSNLPIVSFEIIIDGGQAQIDQIRTVIASQPQIFRDGFGWMTTQELSAQSAQLAKNAKLLVNGILLIILFVAGCSLAVSAGGAIVERKRPFGLLRVAGMSIRQLRRVVLYESAVPLVASTLLAAGLGYLVGALLIQSFVSPGEAVVKPLPLAFCGLLALGIGVALLAIAATLPLLNALTKPEKARFE